MRRAPAPVAALLAFALALTFTSPAAAGAPEQRLAVVVGANVGVPGELPLRWAEKEAQSFWELLVDLGRVAPSNAYLLLGADAARVEAVFAEVSRRVTDIQRGREGGRVLLIFYYSGHADGVALHPAGDALSFERLRALLAGTGADTVVGFVDACQSGALVRAKGLEVLPPYDLEVEALTQTSGQVLVTSSGPGEVSLEADDLRGSYFSHALVSGLRGDADADGDGAVGLAEVYEHCYHSTVVRSAHSPLGAQHPGYHWNLRGTGDIALTWPDASKARLTIGPAAAGSYLVVSKYAHRVVAELTVAEGQRKSLALPAQSYVVRKRVAGGVMAGDVNLTWGGQHVLDESELQFVPYAVAVQKGPNSDRHELHAAFRVRNGVIAGNDYLLGAALAYHLRLLDALGLELELGFGQGETVTRDAAVDTRGLELSAGLAYIHELGRVQLRVGGTLGGGAFWQDLPRDHRSTPSFTAGLLAAMAWIPADPFTLNLGLRGGIELQEESNSPAWGPFVAATVGFGLRL